MANSLLNNINTIDAYGKLYSTERQVADDKILRYIYSEEMKKKDTYNFAEYVPPYEQWRNDMYKKATERW